MFFAALNVILLRTKVTNLWLSLCLIYELVFKKSFVVVEEKNNFILL